jgi:hypothetical protein
VSQTAEGVTGRRPGADDAVITGSRRDTASRAVTFTGFWRYPSPWMLSAMLIGAVTARLVGGDWQRTDLLIPAIMIAVFPFAEWAIHVAILHWRPRTVAGHTVDSLLARKHREHHADPRDVPLVFIPWQVLSWLIPADTAIALLAFPRLQIGLTFLVVLALMGLGYEWTHYLIHSDYRPKSAIYKAIWRNHRLHHYKNEHYWFTVTTSGTADRVLGTHPDPATTATSRTAKNLHSLAE